jgi:hypothetical protein
VPCVSGTAAGQARLRGTKRAITCMRCHWVAHVIAAHRSSSQLLASENPDGIIVWSSSVGASNGEEDTVEASGLS